MFDYLVHIWEFHGYPGYQTTMERLYNHPDYKEYLTKLMPLLRKRSNQMCLEFASWPTSSPREVTMIYFTITYLGRRCL